VVYDKNNNEIERQNNLNLEIMNRLNNNPEISTIKIDGGIPFVTSRDISLVLVDTPGPNNSRDKAHSETTHGMLAKSSKTLVLYILNATQLSVNDDNSLLNAVAASMKVGGKQSKDRFLFVVNKLDDYRSGEDSIESALAKTRSYLADKGIENPNIYPVAALPALDIISRESLSEDDFDQMEVKVKKFNRNEEFHFESQKYVAFPPSIRGKINNALDEAKNGKDIYQEAFIHTGIYSLEEAIDFYMNKYARTAKIKNLVATFEKKLEEANSFEKLKKDIASDEKQQEEIRLQIEEIERKLADGENAKKYKEEINQVDMSAAVLALQHSSLESAVKKITKASEELSGKRLSKSEVDAYCKQFERLTGEIEANLKEDLGDKITEMVGKTSERLIEIYKEKLSSLSAEQQIESIKINPLELVSGQFTNTENSELLYEKYKEQYEVETGSHREKNSERNGFLGFFKVWKPWRITVADYETKEDIPGEKFADRYFGKFREHIENIGDETEKYAKSVTESIKNSFEKKFTELDNILGKKLEELKAYTGNCKNLEAKLAETNKRLEWLEGVQGKVQSILDI
jgi:hypothetical protein